MLFGRRENIPRILTMNGRRLGDTGMNRRGAGPAELAETGAVQRTPDDPTMHASSGFTGGHHG